MVAAITLVLGTGDFTLKFGGFALGGIGTATFGAILLYALSWQTADPLAGRSVNSPGWATRKGESRHSPNGQWLKVIGARIW
jgi:hypothetical protein